MKAKLCIEIESNEQLRAYSKVDDMKNFIFHLCNNSLRPLEHKEEVSVEDFREVINELLETYDINVEDLFD